MSSKKTRLSTLLKDPALKDLSTLHSVIQAELRAPAKRKPSPRAATPKPETQPSKIDLLTPEDIDHVAERFKPWPWDPEDLRIGYHDARQERRGRARAMTFHPMAVKNAAIFCRLAELKLVAEARLIPKGMRSAEASRDERRTAFLLGWGVRTSKRPLRRATAKLYRSDFGLRTKEIDELILQTHRLIRHPPHEPAPGPAKKTRIIVLF